MWDTWIFESEEEVRETFEKFPPDELAVLSVFMFHHDLNRREISESAKMTAVTIMKDAQKPKSENNKSFKFTR